MRAAPLFTLGMLRSWQHSEDCADVRRDICICGLTALVGQLERQCSNPNAVFLINVSRTDMRAGFLASEGADHAP